MSGTQAFFCARVRGHRNANADGFGRNALRRRCRFSASAFHDSCCQPLGHCSLANLHAGLSKRDARLSTRLLSRRASAARNVGNTCLPRFRRPERNWRSAFSLSRLIVGRSARSGISRRSSVRGCWHGHCVAPHADPMNSARRRVASDADLLLPSLALGVRRKCIADGEPGDVAKPRVVRVWRAQRTYLGMPAEVPPGQVVRTFGIRARFNPSGQRRDSNECVANSTEPIRFACRRVGDELAHRQRCVCRRE